MPEEKIPPNQIVSEEGAHELATSEKMKPYLTYHMAEIQGHDTDPAREAVAALPLEDRYTWRVLSALKWAFADFEDENVKIDMDTLNVDDLAKVSELLRHRPLQFCMFLSALIGPDEMKRVMLKAISEAKQ